MENRSTWVGIIQNIITLIFLPWAAWISATIFMHSIAIAEIRQWRDSRPKFATKEELSLAILANEKELREKLTIKLDAILEKANTIDRRLAEHLAETKRP